MTYPPITIKLTLYYTDLGRHTLPPGCQTTRHLHLCPTHLCPTNPTCLSLLSQDPLLCGRPLDCAAANRLGHISIQHPPQPDPRLRSDTETYNPLVMGHDTYRVCVPNQNGYTLW